MDGAVAGSDASVWAPSTYFWVIVLTGIPAALAVAVAAALGQPWVGAVVAGLPFVMLILWKPEIGVFLMAALVMFEDYAQVVAQAVTLTKVLGITTLLVLLVHRVGDRRFRVRSPALWLAVAFAFWSLLTMAVATVPGLALNRSLTRIQMAGLLFLMLNACLTHDQARALFWSLFIGAFLAATAAFFLTPMAEGEGARRVALAGGANRLGKALMAGLFLAPWLVAQNRRWVRFLLVMAALVILVSYAATGSRQGYIALIPGLLVAVLAYRRLSLPRRLVLVVVIVVFVGLVGLVGVWVGAVDPHIYERLVELQQEGLEAGHRLRLWRLSWRMGIEHPLMGVGAGNVRVMMLGYGEMLPAHNEFLEHFAELGILGVLIYLGFLVAVYWQLRRVADPLLKVCLLGLFVSEIVASLAASNAAFKPFWLQMGACLLAGMHFSRVRAGTSPEGSATRPLPSAMASRGARRGAPEQVGGKF